MSCFASSIFNFFSTIIDFIITFFNFASTISYFALSTLDFRRTIGKELLLNQKNSIFMVHIVLKWNLFFCLDAAMY